MQGSRILSRSFTISHLRAARAARGPPNDATALNGSDHREGEESQDGWEEDDWDVPAMVAIADMLNAAYQRDNARLYDLEEHDFDDNVRLPAHGVNGNEGYAMLAESQIKAGTQIVQSFTARSRTLLTGEDSSTRTILRPIRSSYASTAMSTFSRLNRMY